MSLRVTFKLADKDLAHLREILKRASALAEREDAGTILDATEDMIEKVRAAGAPDFIIERVDKLQALVWMIKDTGWPMPANTRARAISALAYFADPHDLIHDRIPGLGFLDDAIMIELVVEQLRHELEGYDAFQKFRADEWERPWYRQTSRQRDRRLLDRRKKLRERIDERQRRDAARAKEKGLSSGGPL